VTEKALRRVHDHGIAKEIRSFMGTMLLGCPQISDDRNLAHHRKRMKKICPVLGRRTQLEYP
jgi:hypothetical protein